MTWFQKTKRETILPDDAGTDSDDEDDKKDTAIDRTVDWEQLIHYVLYDNVQAIPSSTA